MFVGVKVVCGFIAINVWYVFVDEMMFEEDFVEGLVPEMDLKVKLPSTPVETSDNREDRSVYTPLLNPCNILYFR